MPMSNYPQKIYVLPSVAPVRQPRYVAQPPPMPQRALKRAAPQSIPTEEILAELLGDDLGPSGPRKRERLNHLTQEEKLDRRKLKNRVAAQNARDKKKERSGKIDEVMHRLIEENRRLRADNEQLRRQNEQLLEQQNQIINEQQLVSYSNPNNMNIKTEQDTSIYSNVVYEEEVVGEEDHCAFESAEFINAPLPRDKANRSTTTSTTNTSPVSRLSEFKKMPVGLLLTALTMISVPTSHSIESLGTSNSSGDIDRRIASFIDDQEAGGSCSSSSASSGSPSQTCEAFSPRPSLTMSPASMSSGSESHWNDDFFMNNTDNYNFGMESSTTQTEDGGDDLLIDPGNWNFENFNEDSIDLNFFNN